MIPLLDLRKVNQKPSGRVSVLDDTDIFEELKTGTLLFYITNVVKMVEMTQMFVDG